MKKMPTRKRTLGDLEGATRLVWKALKRAAQLLDDRDPQVALKAAHAVFQGATAYAKLHEVQELRGRVEELEAMVIELRRAV